MKKITLEFSEDADGCFPQDEVDMLMQASAMRCALWDIAQEIFRPARKHGYSDPRKEELLNGKSMELVGLLETQFYEILEARGISLD